MNTGLSARFSFLPAKEPAKQESVVLTTMANSENVDRFNKIASEAFAMLYESFPIPLNFDPTDFDIPKGEHGEVQQTDWNFVVAVIDWLDEEGYFRKQSRSMEGSYYEAVLSSKGLAVLRLIPDALDNPEPLGDQMKSAVKNGATAVAMKLVDKAFDIGIRYTMARAGFPT
jgi:hypothetical protein